MPTTVAPWQIYHLYVPQLDKSKFAVIVATMPEIRGFLINSRRPFFAVPGSNFYKCNVEIPCNRHPFLNYDSFVDCNNAFKFTREQLSGGEYKGAVDAGIRTNIRQAIQDGESLKRKVKTIILSNLP